jgi:hypothetical protein
MLRLTVAALSLSACKGSITSPFGNEGRLLSIAISGDSLVQVGDTIRLSARGKVDGVLGVFSYDRVLDATWSISDPAVASLIPVKLAVEDSTSGSAVLLRGLKAGGAQVTVTARGVSGARAITVLQRAAQ